MEYRGTGESCSKPATMPIEPRQGEKIGPYLLIEKIGSGQFGEVWKAQKYEMIAPPCAIKFPTGRSSNVESVMREAKVWMRASGHPNVVTMIEAGVYDGQLIIVSEYVQTGSLQDWLERHGGRAPSTEVAVEMMIGILSGLEHLHQQEIIHRDLKPANILLQIETPRLADFGLARVLNSMTSSMTVAGSLPYMAPETFRKIRTEQTDLWAAGVIFYEMLTGKLPFNGDDLASTMGMVINQAVPPLQDHLQARFGAIIERALEKDMSQRYRTAGQMRDALRAVSQRVEKTVSPGQSSRGLSSLISNLLTTRPQSIPGPDPNGVNEDIGNGVVIEMIRVPGGRFKMGSERRQDSIFNDEGPLHEVRVREFLIGRYPVTQAEWKAVMATNPSYFKGDRLPVENVSWEEAREFCRRLNQKVGLSGTSGYRLPSEAEWEYAARAGTTTDYCFGESINTDLANYDGSQSSDRRKGRYRGKTVEVGSLGSPNAWGLFDMHGNVSEWCEDDFHSSYDSAPADGRPWVDMIRASFRINRGGGWYDPAVNCRSSSRGYDAPGYRGFIIGFRLARTLR
ncbi:MAG: hypothetical protein EBU88_00810 [Acidobacteria bacterium]|nr:hypothetical protein [Acidobacteriota bacterium]